MTIPDNMRAMIFEKTGQPLSLRKIAVPVPAAGEILIRVSVCGVCRTDLHIADNELPGPKLPLIPGHQIVGRVASVGPGVEDCRPGDRVGVPWLGRTCGQCSFCLQERENLCDHPLFTGYTRDGGYAEYTVADRRYAFRLPDNYTDLETAPLLCAGLIGYRTYKTAGKNCRRIGIYGFGAAAHIITQIAVHEGREVYAFTRTGDREAQEFAMTLGAVWAGDSTMAPPEKLDAALIFAPVGSLVPEALKATAKGAIVVCGGIHMSDIPSFPYSLLWQERQIRSVANLTRTDGLELLDIAARVPIRTTVQPFRLEQANEALLQLRSGKINGAAVLVVSGS